MRTRLAVGAMRTALWSSALSLHLSAPSLLMAEPAADKAREQVNAAKEKARAGLEEAKQEARQAIKEAREAGHAAHQEAHEAVKEAREQAHEAVKEGREHARDALKAAHGEVHGMAKRARDRALRLVQDAEAALTKPPTDVEQEDRRGKARKARWRQMSNAHPDLAKGPEQIPPAAREELKVHARRMARLARAQAVAAEAKDEAARGRAHALMQKEIARHKQQLMAVWNQRDKQPAGTEAEAAKAPSEKEGAQ
jgi:vacuolar-type H+-ATPase subunit H